MPAAFLLTRAAYLLRRQLGRSGWERVKPSLAAFLNVEAERLGLKTSRPGTHPHHIKTQPQQRSAPVQPPVEALRQQERERNRSAWIQLQRDHPSLGMSKLRQLDHGLYLRLRRDNKHWLADNSPTKETSILNRINEELAEMDCQIATLLPRIAQNPRLPRVVQN